MIFFRTQHLCISISLDNKEGIYVIWLYEIKALKLPDTFTVYNFQDVLAKAYQIQVSNNGEHFSTPATMIVYSSKCANCSHDDQGDAQCTGQVTGYCSILSSILSL